MNLEVITPEAKIFEGEVSSVTFQGTDGAFQILNNHAPLISMLKSGAIVYRSNIRANNGQVNISGGMVEVLRNQVIVLVDQEV